MGDCIGTSAASCKCCTCSPKGSQAVDLVKDLWMDRMSKLLGRIEGKLDVSFGGQTGGGPLGCSARWYHYWVQPFMKIKFGKLSI